MPEHEPDHSDSTRQIIDAACEQRGPRYWRSLEELADTEQFRKWLADEFPSRLADWVDYDGIDRRAFLKVMAASFALASLPACSGQPQEKIVPYVQDPDPSVVPGEALFFATAMTRGPETIGVLAESHQGRPTKLEGNPDHPASRGATDLFTQAEVLTLCDPDRSQAVVGPGSSGGGDVSNWATFGRALRDRLGQRKGAGLRILTGALTSPTVLAQLRRVLEQYPQAKWHAHEPIGRANARAGAKLATGRELDTVYDFTKAKTILSLDADFLFALSGSVRYARDFAERRRVRTHGHGRNDAKMNRLYSVEPSPSLTGAKADHRLPVRSERVAAVAAAVARELGVQIDGETPELGEKEQHWAGVCAEDLHSAGAEGLVVVGESQPPEIHALALAINQRLGSVGGAVRLIERIDRIADTRPGSLPALVHEMDAGDVDTLVILDTNPAYTAPADLRFAHALSKVPLTVHMGLFDDETAALCRWHLPMTHALESWGDARAYDGTATIIQPLIAPLYNGHTPQELLAEMVGDPVRSARDAVRDHWRQAMGEPADFESVWEQMLRTGVVPGSASEAAAVQVGQDFSPPRLRGRAGVGADPRDATPHPTTPRREGEQNNATGDLTLSFRPSPTLWDGRYANNGWLQEIPDPLTKLTWGNAVLVSPATAKQLGVVERGGIELSLSDQRKLTATVYTMPGQAEGELTIALGYGRTRVGRVGEGVGVSAYPLRTRNAMWMVKGVSARPTEAPYELATTQNHQTMEGRHQFRAGTLDTFRRDAGSLVRTEGEAAQHEPIHLSLMPEQPGSDAEPNAQQQWGMSIDLTACIGCNACTIACQAENAIPVVGKTEVQRGREMHWIRLDRYFDGPPEHAELMQFHHQPIPCMHCEDAPCEIVCPVGATQHSEEGLNEMIYNRCVGTRYCSNNCPYKVRRFNFLQYAEEYDSTYALQKNPDVTVRARGVMEKCTYCVQRIRRAQIDAQKNDRTTVRDGEIKTACQQVCPTQAIKFGDVADKNTEVSKEKAQPHDYGVLEELNTKPRTTYLAEVRNPNPALTAGHPAGGERP